MQRLVGRLFCVVALTALALAPQPARAAGVDPDLLAGLAPRSIGPATMSGRIAAVDAVESNPDVLYVGAATGGVWKSTNGGLTMTPIFDDQPVHSIGAVAINQAHPDIVWVGTGEGNVRNSASIGNGVYRTLDGGKSWKRYTEDDGLPKGDLGRIGLSISRSNPLVVYALVEAEKSALLRSTDGGKTWEKANEDHRTAERPFYYSDIKVDPAWPNRLYNLTARLMVSDDSGKSFPVL